MPRSWLELGSILGGSPHVANVVREDFDEVERLNRWVLPAAEGLTKGLGGVIIIGNMDGGAPLKGTVF